MRSPLNRASNGHRHIRLIGCLLTTAGIVLAASPVSAEKTLIYKSVARDGSVEFTDQAAPDAVIITPSPLNIVDSPSKPVSQEITDPAAAAPAQATTAPASAALADDSLTITSVIIESPVNQETLIDHQGPIWVVIRTSPAKSIPAGLTAEVTLDGKRVVTGSSDRLPISVPARGTHQIQVKIVDHQGQVVAESAQHDLHIKQQVVKNTH